MSSNSFMLWHRDPQSRLGIASDRRVLRAAEVPALQAADQVLADLRELFEQEQVRVEAACAQAREEGLRQGLADAEVKAREQLAVALTRLTHAHEEQCQRQQRDLARLALEVFQKLLGALPADEGLARLAAQAARELLPARTWRMHVHPSRMDSLRTVLQAVDPDDQAGLSSAEIVADAELAEGDCRLITEFGTADASLATQVARLARAWGLAP